MKKPSPAMTKRSESIMRRVQGVVTGLAGQNKWLISCPKNRAHICESFWQAKASFSNKSSAGLLI